MNMNIKIKILRTLAFKSLISLSAMCTNQKQGAQYAV